MLKITNEILVKRICVKNEICMAFLAGDAAHGDIPLTADQMGSNWAPNNPYKKKAVILANMENEESDPLPDLNKKNKSAQKKLADLGLENVKYAQAFYKSDFEEVESELIPTRKQITKALNTFKISFKGEKQKTMDRVDQLCKVELMADPSGNNLVRLVSLLPFMGQFDPWLEFFGKLKEDIEGKSKK